MFSKLDMDLVSFNTGGRVMKSHLFGAVLLWLCGIVVPNGLHAQPFPIFNGSSSTCQGALLDTGGQGASGYSNNENITYTVCPDTPGGAISLNFITANLSTAGTAPIDNITIFDGDNVSAPQLGSWTGTALQGQIVSASAGNPTGCLTIRFRSNNTGTGVFAATISCYQPCIRPTAVATHGATGPQRICPGESVTFNSSASFAAPGQSIANRRWDFGDGTILNNAQASVSHTYSQPGGYMAQLYLLDNNGCASTNTVDLLVLVGTPPSFNGTSPAQTGCVGETLCLTGAVTGTTWTEPPASSVGAGIFLPDQVGTCFTSTITLDQFAPGAVLTSANGLQSICLNMEHSFIGDLVISIISPTGQTVTLHQQGGGGTYLGVPVDNDATPNAQGTCWVYCWSPTATNGTWVANANGGTLPSGTYQSLNSLNGLIGSQLNGTWTIQICDLWASDNGFVCDWQLGFDPSLYDDLIEFTPSYGAACDSSFWSGPNISSTTGNCNGICVTPPAPGSYTYTYTVTDDFGCTYNTTSTVNMIPGPVVNAGLDAVSCGTPVSLGASVTSGGFPTTCNYTLTLYDSFGDGWTGLFGGANGSNVTVTVNGVPSSWTLPNGSQGSVTIPVSTGSTISVSYTVAGAFNNEQSFTLFNSTGDVVYASPVGPNGGLAWSGIATCSGGGFIYSWTPASGLNNPNIANPTATVASTTQYCVTAYQQGHPSCTSTDCTTITVDVGTVDPGTNGSIALCANGPVTDLFGELGGTPQAGGSWTNPSGATHSGSFVPSTDASGIYTYSVTSTGACGNTTSSATVTVVVSPLSDAGIGGALTFCASDGVQDLTSALTGSPSIGGTWTGPSGAVHSGAFAPGSDAPGTYTYSVAGVAPCPSSSAVLNIAVNTPPVPGTNGSITLCSSDAAVNLFSSLGGTPQAGGTWTAPGGGASTGTFDPASGAAGAYTYTVAGVAPCPSESATVTVAVNTPPVPGTDGNITLCSTDAASDLFTVLGGAPQAGGTWTAPGGGAASGTFDPASGTPGTYTYTVAGTAPCPSESATVTVAVNTPPVPGTNGSITVTVAVNTPPVPGTDGNITLCSTDAASDLFTVLGGAPQAGGTWTAPGGGAASGTFDPASGTPGTYTYTVAGTAPCPSESATVTVAVNTPPVPGTNGSITLCSSDAAVNLFSSLGGTPQAGGTWTAPSGGVSTGTFDPASGAAGAYTYTVAGVAPCPSESATVTVAVNTPPVPGTDGNITLCSTDAASDLFTVLGGAPQAGGTWTAPGGGAASGTFDPASGTPGTYTYTVAGTAPCPSESATVTVAVNTPPVPGTNGSITLCSSDAAVNLFSSLGGTPQAGGTWTAPGGGVSTGTFDPASGAAGAYTYTVAGVAPCPSESATVTVAVNTPPVPGTDGNITLCSTDAASDLFTVLGGAPQAGGTWTAPGGGAASGTFDPASGTPGTYTYTVAGTAPCPSESATVTVAVNTPPVPGTNGSITLCSSDAAVNLFSSLGGTPQAGGTWTAPGGGVSTGTFDPASGAAGAYTYTVAGVAPCPSESATVTVAVNTPPVPGTDGNITLCSTDAASDLFTVLGGAPQAGGTWTAPGGGAASGTFDPASGTPGTYTYTVAGTAPCPSESATVTVAVNTPPVPGTNGSITLCSSDAAVNLFSSLGGTPQAGGTWTAPGGGVSTGTFDPASGAAGAYTYTVAGVAPCPSESATVTVAVNTPPVPGTDGNITLCSTDAASDLFTVLGGAPQAGGTWTAPGGGAASGTFDPASGTPGTYTYTVAGTAPCPSESATVTVAVNTPPVPGTNGSITLCSSDAAVNLFSSLGGTPQAGGTWTAPGGGASTGTFDPASGAAGAYTYTVAGVAPCPSESATVTVAVNTPPVPGTDGNITLCSTDAASDLFSVLGGAPQAGGTWTAPGGGAASGTFDPASGTPGTYTYTVAGTAPCPSESATVTVAVNTPPVPGTNGSITLCSSDAAVNLFSSLGGTPQAGGTWTAPGGGVSTGTFDPASGAAGAYTYTVAGVAPCPSESATVTVAVNTPPVPGTDGNITLCSTDAASDLFTVLGGAPQAGGTWTAPGGGAASGTFDPASGTPGTYTYTVAGTAPCPSESATVTVAVNTPPVPGTSGSITLCSSDAAVNLFSSLGGTPQAGGTWTAPGGSVSTGTFDPASGAAGAYTYTVAGVAPCPSESATVTVAVNTPPVPGTDGNITLCSTDAASDLFTVLGGAPQAGGTWTAPGGGAASGTFDPASGTPGTYTYTVAGTAPCPSESATVTVAVNTPPVPGTNGSITLCSSDAAVNLFSSLGGTPQAGGTWTAPGGGVSTGTFDPASGAAGAYTYTVAGVAPCPSESATVTVAVNTPPVPGTDGNITLCSTDAASDLFSVLGGAPQAGGTWTAPGGGAASGTFDPASGTPGTYTYTVAGTAPCPSESATVTVAVNTPPVPGTNGSITLCSSDAAVNLFSSLGTGTPQAGGTWTAPGRVGQAREPSIRQRSSRQRCRVGHHKQEAYTYTSSQELHHVQARAQQ
jgi:subtilisin-like proprotein convertase family protein